MRAYISALKLDYLDDEAISLLLLQSEKRSISHLYGIKNLALKNKTAKELVLFEGNMKVETRYIWNFDRPNRFYSDFCRLFPEYASLTLRI
jgi:hypothetical protein